MDEDYQPRRKKKSSWGWVTWDQFVLRFALLVIIVLLIVIAVNR